MKNTLNNTFSRGVAAAWPICLGYAPIGLAFGVLAQKAGLTPLSIGLMSIIVFAGSSQFIAVSIVVFNGGRLLGSQMHLPLVKLIVKSSLLHQFLVPADFCDPPAVQDNDLIRIANRAQAMSDDQRRATVEHSFQGLLNQVLGFSIH